MNFNYTFSDSYYKSTFFLLLKCSLNSIIICKLIPNSVRAAQAWCVCGSIWSCIFTACVCVCTCTCCHTYEKRLGKKSSMLVLMYTASLLEEIAVYLADRLGTPLPLQDGKGACWIGPCMYRRSLLRIDLGLVGDSSWVRYVPLRGRYDIPT